MVSHAHIIPQTADILSFYLHNEHVGLVQLAEIQPSSRPPERSLAYSVDDVLTENEEQPS